MMTRQEALKLARKRWGKRAFTTLHKEAVVGEEREALRAEQKKFSELYKSLPEKTAERRAAYAEWERLRNTLIVYRCGVGYVHDSFLGPIHSTNGIGDTWEEACANARIT
jgi:hypothetical protein